MADIILDGKVKVWSVPSIANIAAPTTAELNAGTNLGALLLKDGGLQGFSPTTAAVDTTPLNATYMTNLPGMAQLDQGTMTFKAQTQATPDFARSTFVKDYQTNIVIRRQGSLETAAWASTDQVEVWPVKCGYRQDNDLAANEVQKLTVPVFFYLQPNQSAVVA
jgi:hypothetical protein